MVKFSPCALVMLVMCCCWANIASTETMKYKDPNQPLNVRIKDLMDRMTLEEKIGQMTQIDRAVASADSFGLCAGSILSGGGSVPAKDASPEMWINMVNEFQRGSLATRLGIPMIYGIDAVHGNNNVYKATIFPHNVGLGVTRQVCFSWKLQDLDPELIKKIGIATALEVRATGINYAFAPCIAVCRDPRWGRCYESYSEDPAIVREMTELIPGLQGDIPPNSQPGVPEKVVACAKHFVGDGGTTKGIDENNTVVSQQELYRIHMPAYYDSVVKGVSTIMISYSSLNGAKMHQDHQLITNFLKNTLNFRGFVISDWEGIDRITDPPHANYTYSILKSVGAGLDMYIDGKMVKFSPCALVMLVMCCCWANVASTETMKYKDPNQPLNVRIKDLMDRMTLEEKIGQMTQIDRAVASADVMQKYFIGNSTNLLVFFRLSFGLCAGSILSGGGSVPAKDASPEMWINMVNEFQRGSLATRLGIPMIYGIDAVHGNNNVYKATIFPHNVGLGVTRQVCFSWKLQDLDPELIKKIGIATALEVRATGINYAFAPCIAVCRDPRWGRCYESYSEDPAIVREMTELIPGLQGDIPPNSQPGVPEKVVACAKHFVGDGGTTKGIDENNTVVSQQELYRIHMPAYYDSVVKGVSTIMISYSSLNGAKMHQDHQLITNFLKNTLNFRGFVISDWEGIDRITDPPHANYTYSILKSVGAGLDMIMVPLNYTEFIDGLSYLVKNNFIPMTRIDDAVKRILRVKFVMGLFENPLADLTMAKYLGAQEHRELAREAVRKSLVLLKNGKTPNEPLLPLPKKSTRILVSGTHANDIGNQCGGWTIEWHGQSGNITEGTTILSAIKSTVDPETEVMYVENPTPEFVKSNNFEYAIVVTGEYPYSEMSGDSFNLTIPDPGLTTITNVCGAVKCVVVLISGRPVVIEPYVDSMDALVAAWLPGSEGQGVADVLYGDYGFTGKLARTWFKTVDQLPMNVGDPHYDPLYPFGYGLTTEPVKANQFIMVKM
ncbi:glycoside hydrolase family 3 C-terminal domain-containing protein [Artemisia annua]|uniref:Glycoside hydrolase family 3 C-terminal domain-containing protein n=1 Tax=Artemisia annua TaxID=35608 RepID=A0A2U1QBS8_ARTAN|nr:glycoside hydrolase family 3 C-terminal domain-containing protein [Artemisia annua]